MPKPTAPKAKEAYKNGTISTYNWDNTPELFYERHIAYPYGMPKEISVIDANDNNFFRPISRKIRREIRAGFYPEGFMANDTVYVEAPKHNGLVTSKYRVASTYLPNGDEYEILKRRFNEAKSVSKPAKKQQGGQLNMNEQELQQAFIQFLALKTGAKSQLELEAVIQQLGEEGLKLAYQEFMQLMQLQQVQAAKFGAKLNYIKLLRGKCPDGYEMLYFKSGGQLCKKCIKKQVMQEGGDIPQNPIDAFKCGRKMKKKEQGGNIEFDKCGKKMKKKKCEIGGTVDMDKCGAKIKKKKCENGGFISFDKCGKKMKKKEFGGSMSDPFMDNKKKKVQNTLNTTSTNTIKKLDPKNTKSLPGGKYPKNWTPKDRMIWERTWGQGDEGAASTTNKGVTKNACGSKLIRKKKS